MKFSLGDSQNRLIADDFCNCRNLGFFHDCQGRIIASDIIKTHAGDFCNQHAETIGFFVFGIHKNESLGEILGGQKCSQVYLSCY